MKWVKRLNLNHEYKLRWYLIESECFVLFCPVGFFEDKIERFFGRGAFLSRRRHFFEIKIEYFLKIEGTFLSILTKIKIKIRWHFYGWGTLFKIMIGPSFSRLRSKVFQDFGRFFDHTGDAFSRSGSLFKLLAILSKIKISVHFLSIVLNFYFSPEPLIFSRSKPHFHRSRFLRRAF